MPDTACLHIQGRDSDPIRVVELPGVSVRIGRASYCEVRLPETDLAEEECQLRRRGSTWHLVPVASPCAITIDGQAVEHSRPLPFGLALRVGAHLLTLRPAGASPPEWSQDHSPIAVETATALATVPSVARPPALVDPEALSRREGLLRSNPKEKRWEARWKAAGEKLRASAPAAPSRPAVAEPPRAPQRPEGWADAELPRREVVSAPASPVARLDTSGFPSAKTVARPPQYPSVENVAPPARPLPTVDKGPSRPSARVVAVPPPKYPPLKPVEPPAARVPFVAHEAVRSGPLTKSPVVPTARWAGPRNDGAGLGARSVGGYTPPAPPHVESKHVPPLAAPTEESLDPLERAEQLFAVRTLGSARPVPRPGRRSEPVPEPAEAPVAPETTHSPDDLGLALFVPPTQPSPTRGEGLIALSPLVGAGQGAPDEQSFRGEGSVTPSPLAGEGRGGGATDPADWPVKEGIGPASEEILNAETVEEPTVSSVPEPVALDASHAIEPPSIPEPGPFDTHMSVTDAGDRFAAGSAISHSTAALSPVAPTKQLMALASATPGAISAREWPAARDILAAHQSRHRLKSEGTARPAPRRRKPRPVPTAVCEPEHWKVPLWLGWLPLTLLTLVVGMGGFKLAREWSNDARIGGIIANHLAVSEPGSKLPLKPEEIPSVPWWKSTAGNLAQLGVALGRTGDPDLQREGESLLRVATQASPFQPSAQFALAHLPGRDEEAPAHAQSLGLSRDVVALAWAGNRLLKAGKKDAALRVYRSALEMAATAEVTRLAVPVYNDDPQVRRYTLPGEALIGQVVREMADQSEWTYAEWAKALPHFAVAPLVAARLLHDSDRTSAEAALDSIVAQADQPTPPGTSAALHCAAQAEAFALKSEWTRAEALYRQAIDQMPSPRVRRAWWVNVADIDLRLNDEMARQKALEAANSHDPNDEITQRVVEIQKFSGYRADKASPRARTAAKSADKS